MHLDQCFAQHACAGETSVVNISIHICLHARYRMCICAYVCAVCSFSVGGTKMGGFNSTMRALVACCGGLFLTERKDRGVVCVFSIFDAGESVCGCMCVYTHTHAHSAQMEYSDVSPGVGMKHLEGPKNPDGQNLGIHLFVYVYKVHRCKREY